MKFVQVASIFLTITTINWTEGHVDYRLTRKLHRYDYFENQLEEECTSTGLACRGCCEIVLCQQNNSVWTETFLGQCPNGELCLNGGCFKHQCTITAELPFICTTVGTFPDPVDGKSYHYCVHSNEDNRVLLDYKINCENNFLYGYNPNSTYCGDELPNGECEDFPVPICKELFQKGALNRNPSLYYSCLTHPSDPFLLYPYQMACPNGKQYDPSCGCL